MLTEPQYKMLAGFAAELSTFCILTGKRGENAVLNALVARDLVRFHPVEPGARVGEFRVTPTGRDAAWARLTARPAETVR